MTSQQPHLDAAFQREARIGLSVLALLIGIFLVVAFGKYSGWFRPAPVTFAAVVDKETGVESLQPFSPFASVNTSDSRPSPNSTITAGNVASEVPPGDYLPSWRNSETPLLPSSSGSASVTPPEFVPQQNLPEFKPSPLSATSSQPQTARELASDGTGSFQPVTPQPNRLMPDQFADSDTASNEGNKLQLSPPVRPPMNAIHDASEQVSEFDAMNSRSTGSFAAAQTGPPMRPSAVAELPSLRETPVVADRHSTEPNTDSVEQVTFNQAEPETQVSSPVNQRISPQSTISEFQVDLPNTPLEEQATSIVSQDGDSFWLIAQRVYGDGRLFNALYEFNRNQVKSFNEIPIGTRISTPPLAELHRKWPQLCPRDSIFASTTTNTSNIYTAVEGDTLFDVARDQLGQASRYLEILQLNTDKLPADTGHATPLPAGVQIKLPVQR